MPGRPDFGIWASSEDADLIARGFGFEVLEALHEIPGPEAASRLWSLPVPV